MPETLHHFVLLIPIVSTAVAWSFAVTLLGRYRRKGGKHLLWWGIGMITYGIGTFTEAYSSVVGLNPTALKIWYVAGAYLGGYPLAQGTIYLLMSRKFADRSAIVVCGLIALFSVAVFMSPVDMTLLEAHRPSGAPLEWSWVRLFSPFINLYALTFLMGGAIVSAVRFRKIPAMRGRYVGNVLIALGALLPAIGGTFTRFGMVEMLYITELLGLILIFFGFRMNILVKDEAVEQARASRAARVAAAAG